MVENLDEELQLSGEEELLERFYTKQSSACHVGSADRETKSELSDGGLCARDALDGVAGERDGLTAEQQARDRDVIPVAFAGSNHMIASTRSPRLVVSALSLCVHADMSEARDAVVMRP